LVHVVQYNYTEDGDAAAGADAEEEVEHDP